MEYCLWINVRRTALLHLIIGAILSRVSVAQNFSFSLESAREHCANQSSHLPGLSSVRDGSLVHELKVNQSTWIDTRIKRGHWQWYSSDMIIHTNQGCFGINENSSFLNKFNQTSSDSSQIECINYCKNNDYFYTGLSTQQSGALVCYCGNDVPIEGATSDSKCRERCQEGDLICGYVGYSRIITSQVYNVSKDVMSWFEAQNFCYTTGTNHDMNTVSLSEVIATNLLEVSVTDFKVEYWTQLSSLHLSSPVAENFCNLPWGEGNLSVLNGQTCIRAMRRDDGIKLILTDCGEENIFICIHSNPANQPGIGMFVTNILLYDKIQQDNRYGVNQRIIVGAVVGGLVIVTVIVVAVVLCRKKKKARSEASASSVAYDNDAAATKMESNVYADVDKSATKRNRQRPCQDREDAVVVDNDLYIQ
ncbi:hypothetical protein CAPTEDRAFT_197721 [Capitella teleta]|uniref:WSC domain-containing protein n=1 Tax=Capitella teleta TaxID=283909 RepID=R7TZ77_CAPTE|nr:hypothetical protein CAPTEDRAFT_197721 [Capitella teleta]|eukprot:ELT99064.1 hypothetical protein CAPTEDRAFT_197721 [Capitella teleta]